MTELVKALLDISIEDKSKDLLIEHYIKEARLIAENYCNVTELPFVYDTAVAELASYLYTNRKSVGYKQIKQGERSITYDENDIPSSIRNALPLPKIKVGASDVL